MTTAGIRRRLPQARFRFNPSITDPSDRAYVQCILEEDLPLLDDLVVRLQRALGDSFALERELGGGAMSRLFLATERSLNRRVVVKLLPPELASETSAARFRREIDVLAHLQHPHILPILNAGFAEGLAYYVMPFVEGESLRARLTGDGRLPIRDAVRIMIEVADALAYAHRRGVVHRDIKPENVLLEEGHAVLADFGIARAVFDSTGGTLTVTGHGVGTPGYMSPEQAAGERDVDARSDLYALGVLGYEMVTGKRPFAKPTAAAELAAHLRDTAVSPRDLRREIPRAVGDAIMRLLVKDPGGRYASAEAFRDALASASSAPVALRGRRLTAGAAALVLVGAAALVVARARRGQRAPSLDPNVIAIAPPNVLAPDLQLWHEGLVDVLSRSLDGAGTLRTVTPTAALKGWSGRADATSADVLGRRTGAAFVVFGTLQRVGRDSVRFSATVREVARGASRGELDRYESVERMDQLADSVAIDVMRILLSGAGSGVRLRSVGTRSLAALKEFLQGQQYYRRSRLDSAQANFLRAIDIDSTFALAYLAMANVRGWAFAPGGGGFEQGLPYVLRAAALNHRLGERDSLRIVADSLFYVAGAGPLLPPRDPHLWSTTQRAFSLNERLIRLYPNDPELIYRHADMRYHLGGIATRTTDREVLEAFRSAIRADSAFDPAYTHATYMAYSLEGFDRGLETARAQERQRGGRSQRVGDFRDSLIRVLGESRSRARLLVDTAELGLLVGAYSWLLLADDSAALYERATDRLRQGAAERGVWNTIRDRVEREEAALLVTRGRLARALTYSAVRGTPAFVALALVDGVPDDSSRAVFREWLASPRPAVDCLLVLEWWAARGDTASVRRCVERRRREVQADTSAAVRRLAEPFSRLGEAYGALARYDSVHAVALFDAFPDTLCPVYCWFTLRPRARLLAARGREQEAFDLLLARSNVEYDISTRPFLVLHALERARLAARLGDAATAVGSYRVVADHWAHADAQLQPHVAEARREIARLGGDVPKTLPVRTRR